MLKEKVGTKQDWLEKCKEDLGAVIASIKCRKEEIKNEMRVLKCE